MLVPFQGFLTVFGYKLVGHYTLLRLWDEILLAICTLGVMYLFLTDEKIRFNTLYKRLIWLILGYIALSVVLDIFSYHSHTVTKKAIAYGLTVNLRYLVFFLVTWSVALRLGRLKKNWHWLVIYPAIAVLVFGLLQIFVFPRDFLKHFGYGPNTIPVIQTINNNSKYIRFGSTLRGANPLGAYLILPISMLAVLLSRPKRSLKQALMMLGAIVVLFYSFSRSAWIGVVLSVVTVILTSKLPKKVKKSIELAGVGLVVIAAVLAVSLHSNTKFQNFVLHTQTHSKVKTTSDSGHIAALKDGIKDAVKHPLGEGPGSAGPASVYNNGKTKISENYFVQIAQETGVLGLIIFIFLNIGVGYSLWLKREDPLALSLFASLIGITFVNLLSHAWTDDTLAFLWWGLAGVAMAPSKPIIKRSAAPKPKIS